MGNRLNILIPDGESTFAFLVIPCLAAYNEANITVLSRKNRNPLKYSRYIKHYKYIAPDEVEIHGLERLNTAIASLSY